MRADQREGLLRPPLLSYSPRGPLLSSGNCDPRGVSCHSRFRRWIGSGRFSSSAITLCCLEYLHHSPLAMHWYTGHFWSLSMEEHFYLVLPAILVGFKKQRLWVLGGLALAIAFWRSVLAHIMHSNHQFVFRTDTHVDALLIPAMIALALYPLARNKVAKRYLPAWSLPVFIGMEICLLTLRIPFSFTFRAILTPLLILSAVLHPNAIAGRILEFKPLRWIGWISYSLYLWQQLFFGANFAGSPPAIAVLRAWPINLVALMVCATFSYYAVERPFVRLGHKLVPGRYEARRAQQGRTECRAFPDSSLCWTRRGPHAPQCLRRAGSAECPGKASIASSAGRQRLLLQPGFDGSYQPGRVGVTAGSKRHRCHCGRTETW